MQAIGFTGDGKKLQQDQRVEVVLPLPKPVRWAIKRIERGGKLKVIAECWLKGLNPPTTLEAIKQRYRRDVT